MKKMFFFPLEFPFHETVIFFMCGAKWKQNIFMRIFFFLNVQNQVIFFSWEMFSSYVQEKKMNLESGSPEIKILTLP